MIAILDYGAGNLRSVQKAFEHLGVRSVITADKDEIKSASHVVLPGVGAFGDAMTGLKNSGLDLAVLDAIHSGKPFLGICVGLQLLFEGSEESEDVEGLGIFKGKICKIKQTEGLKIPQMGWNSLHIMRKTPLFKGISEGDFVYFVHSYYPAVENINDSIARVSYGTEFDVAVHKENVFATQFHPEKSGSVGLKILSNFASF